jgi:hypothetical protein
VIDWWGVTTVGPVRLTPRRATLLGGPAPAHVSSGEFATFTARAGGRAPVEYQWLRNGVPLPGATDPELTVGPLTLCDGAQYAVAVSNAFGGETSPPVPLSVGPEAMVVGWGDRPGGQPVPFQLTNDVVAVALGRDHAVALFGDGRVLGWGDDSRRQIRFAWGQSQVRAVAAGDDFTLLLTVTGGVVAVGDDSQNQIRVPVGLRNIEEIAAGEAHGVALNSTGVVRAWGRWAEGQTVVPPDLPPVSTIGAGARHTLAALATGQVRAWGANDAGQTDVPEELTAVMAVAGGARHSLALRQDGTVVAWGDNTDEQSTVPATATNVVAIAAAANHSMALRQDGQVIAWGRPIVSPTVQPVDLTGAVSIAAGPNRGLAVIWRPRIFRQPCGEPVMPGTDHTLAIDVLGPGPLIRQWFRDGQPMAGQTNVTLQLRSFGLDQVGIYHLQVRNRFGTATSLPVFVGLPASPPYLDWRRDGESLVLRWQTADPAPALEVTGILGPGDWSPVPVESEPVGYLHRLRLPIEAGAHYFRLRE